MYRAIALSALLTGLWLVTTPALTPDTPDFAQTWDHHAYIAMAQGETVNAPYAYRVLTPGLAHILPFDLTISFRLITIVALWATGIAVYALARAWEYTPGWALVGCGLFYTLYWSVGFALYDFWLCDPLTFLCVTLAIRAAKLQKRVQFAALMAVGVLNKEAVLAVVPLWWVFNPDWRGLWVFIPAALVFVGLRLLIHPVGIPAGTGVDILGWRLRTFDFSALKDWTVGTFGGLFVLPYLTRRNLRTLRLFGAFLALIYAQLLIANNTERLLVLAFPMFILMSIEGLRWQTARR
jgi:hypothetical protein